MQLAEWSYGGSVSDREVLADKLPWRSLQGNHIQCIAIKSALYLTVHGPKPRCKCLNFHVIKNQVMIFQSFLWLDIQLVFCSRKCMLQKKILPCLCSKKLQFIFTYNKLHTYNSLYFMHVHICTHFLHSLFNIILVFISHSCWFFFFSERA